MRLSLSMNLLRIASIPLAVLLLGLGAGNCGESWSFYGGNLENTHFAKRETSISAANVDQLQVKWVYQTTPDVPMNLNVWVKTLLIKEKLGQDHPVAI